MEHERALRGRHAAALLAALGAASVAPACDGATAPADSPLAGQVFVLTAVGGGALPAVTNTYLGDTTFLVADTLRFQAGGKVARSMAFLTRGVHGTQTDSSRWSSDYRVTGARIEIGFFTPCPPTALCIANDVGAIWQDQLLLTVDMTPPPPARTYRRVGRG